MSAARLVRNPPDTTAPQFWPLSFLRLAECQLEEAADCTRAGLPIAARYLVRAARNNIKRAREIAADAPGPGMVRRVNADETALEWWKP